jgi:hypothetical protein
MAVMMPREKWTDERLDDLNKKVDDGFARVDKDIRELRGEMITRFDAMNESVNARFDKLNDSINARFDAMNARFDAQNRNLLVVGATIVAALIGVNAF